VPKNEFWEACMTVNRRSAMALMGGGIAAASGCQATTGTAQRLVFPTNYFDATPKQFPQFAVVPKNPKYGFNFDVWDKLTRAVVLDFGRSARVSLGKPPAEIGSRFAKGHQSPYRAEGNRIAFSLFKKNELEIFTQARQALEVLGNRAPISQFSWSDQLAYWFNLHNAIMIEQLALRYPTPFPDRLLVGPNSEPLHSAKLVTIEDTPLSLRDIRVEIVYRGWRHPGVIYGFFHGDVGGPSIRRGAYVGARVNRQLADMASEFINSLRGVREYNSFIGVSRLYEETMPLFPQWPSDFRAHLMSFAEDDVAAILETGKPLQIKQYDNRIADLAGGNTSGSSVSRSPITGIAPSDVPSENDTKTVAGPGGTIFASVDRLMAGSTSSLPPHAARTMADRERKLHKLRLRGRGRRKGTVVITDLPSRPVN
jgi:Protein of unknown function, DUF547